MSTKFEKIQKMEIKKIDKRELLFEGYYLYGNPSGLQNVYTPKEIRDQMIVYAEPWMKILVLFNYEFCFDLQKMRCNDVVFASDDEMRNRMVSELLNFETKMIDPEHINKNFKNEKFDLIISNPPFKGTIQFKILKNIYGLSERICFFQVSKWLMYFDTFYSSIYKKVSELYNDKLEFIHVLNSNKIFNIDEKICPYSINYFHQKKDKIHVIDESLYYSNEKHEYDVENIIDVNIYAWNKNFQDIKKKISNKQIYRKMILFNNVRGDFLFGIPNIRGNLTIVQKDFEKHLNNPKYIQGYSFDSKEECKNCYDYFTTKFARFCLSIKKHDFNTHRKIIDFVSRFDFTRSWTDEECAAELGITDEELLWMIQQIPDYYDDDSKTYRALENKLKERIEKC